MKQKELGQWGEQLAREHLIANGYAILESNWRFEHFEIDIIAMKNGRLVFVEVKTRRSPDSNPVEAVTPRKQARMVASANAFVERAGLPHQIQFDVIAIRGIPGHYELEHFPDAFYPTLRTH